MDFSFSIHFGDTRSAGYDKAVKYASMFDKFTRYGYDSDLNIIETNNHEVLEKYHLFQNLMDTISAWKSAGVIYRDKETDPAVFSLGKNEIAECYMGYMKEQNKADYCDDKTSNCWGCRHLKGVILRHAEAPYSVHAKYWYQYGEFTNKTTWHINKEELTQSLTEIVEKKSIEFCPTFHYKFFRKLVAALPSSIDVTDTKNWGLKYLDDTISRSRNWEAVSIYHKTPHSSPVKGSKAAGKDIEQDYSAKDKKISENKYLRFIPETSFADIGGIDDVIQTIRTVIELPIKKPELYEHLGIKPYRGILLWGEPGNGKTLIAKAIAHEVEAHFIPIIGPDILNKSFGESEKNLRSVFEEARELQPSVIFIDEIDSIAQTRLAGESSKWYATVVNQLMTLMDGIKEFGNITVLASTNRPDLLDAALLRPGRFDYKLEVRKPNLPGCKKILDIVTRGIPLADDVDLFAFAESVLGYSAAEITFIAKEAAMVALRRTVDIKAIISEDNAGSDINHIEVKRIDFLGALQILKWNRRYVNMTYSLKG